MTAALLALAVKIMIGALRRHRTATVRPAGLPAPVATDPATPTAPRAYLTLVGMTMINPLTVLYFTALIIGLDTGTVGRLLTGPRGRLATTLASALVITAFALRQLLP